MKFQKLTRNSKALISLIIVLFASSCSQNLDKWDGIWRAETEAFPGLQTALEFELHRNFFNRWSGQWEMIELLSSGEMLSVKIANANIELDFGLGWQFKGKWLENKTSIEGIVYIPDRENDTLKFIMVDDWTSKMPARIDEFGRAVKSWHYEEPELIENDWPIATLKDANISQQSLKELFQKVVDDGRHEPPQGAPVADEARRFSFLPLPSLQRPAPALLAERRVSLR